MQSENRIFEDLSKMLNGLAGTVAGMGREAQDTGRERMRAWLGGMDFVGRDEFEAVKAMAAAARDEVAALKAELASLKGSPPARPGEPGIAPEMPPAAGI